MKQSILQFIILLILSFVLIYFIAPQTEKEIIGENETNDRLKKILKNSLPYIFTKRKKLFLIASAFLIIYALDLTKFDITDYFTVSLTSLSLLLTTSNISRNLFTPQEILKLQKETWENYLGRFIFAAVTWVVINLLALIIPLIPILKTNLIVKGVFLELLILGILILFDLLSTTIMLYRKK
ncbi:hypothetical protein ACFDAA_18230 [Enterococcus casseliflavus]|uniref:hypothetical protein n=1 Tax=Enterococcus casseliflavus TaxID=37734 RepID=UPI0039A44E4C